MRHPWVGVDDGTVAVHQLADRLLSEPCRQGEGDRPDRSQCAAAESPDEREVYRDDLWRVFVIEDIAFAGSCMLSPLSLQRRERTNASELAAYGPIVARITQALMDRPQGAPGFGDGRVGRVHSRLWNDGGAHLHQWFIPRPLGYLDPFGSVLIEWEVTLPRACRPARSPHTPVRRMRDDTPANARKHYSEPEGGLWPRAAHSRRAILD